MVFEALELVITWSNFDKLIIFSYGDLKNEYQWSSNTNNDDNDNENTKLAMKFSFSKTGVVFVSSKPMLYIASKHLKC